MSASRIGVVVALDAEAQTLYSGTLSHQRVITVSDQLSMVVSGMGPQAAGQAAEQLLQSGVAALLSWGTAGGLNPDGQAGDLLVPEQVVWNGRHWPVDPAWRMTLLHQLSSRVPGGGLCSVSVPCASVAAKAELRAAHPESRAVDMESGAVAECAARADLPFLVVRSVVDPANQALPVSATRSVDAYGRPRWLPLLGGLLRHPGDLPALMGLGRQMQAALQSLRRVQPYLETARPS